MKITNIECLESLEILHIHNIGYKEFSNLDKLENMKEIYISGDEKCNLKHLNFPNGLKKLFIYGSYKFDYGDINLPEGLEVFGSRALNDTILNLKLPFNLKKLETSSLYHKYFINKYGDRIEKILS